jgi:hypothetical protein
MTREEYDKLVTELQRRGYRKYPSSQFRNEDYSWFKSFGKSKFEEDRSNYQVCFDVIDFSPYADREPRFREDPYGIEPLVLISRTVDERVDLHLSYTKVDDQNIDEIERLAESFYHWVEKEVEV